MKFVVATLVVILGLATAGDFIARNIAEDRVAERLHDSLDLEEQPDVSIEGFPFVLNLVRGSIPRIEVEAGPVNRGEVQFEEVSLGLVNVRFDAAALSSGDGAVRIGGGRGEAVMSDDTLTMLLRQRGAPVRVRFAGNRTFVTADDIRGEAEGSVSLDGRRLVISSPDLPDDYGVALPSVGEGATYRSVSVGDGEARLILALRTGSLTL